MGVPGFFSWLLKNRKKLLDPNTKLLLEQRDVTDVIGQIDWLMLDTNCLLHPAISHVVTQYKKGLLDVNTREQLEQLAWEQIEFSINEMISKTDPKNIFIAIDGVAPMGKILQQRQRRYKYLYDLTNSLVGTSTSTSTIINQTICPITSIELTPGTEFMERLHQRFLLFVQNICTSTKCVYSSYHELGEGEHKIIQYIKTSSEAFSGKTILIYGLDADLLFLTLGLGDSYNLHVMREKQEFTNKPLGTDMSTYFEESYGPAINEYNYVPIKSLRNMILKLDISVNDFIVLCYLVGNDFFPRLLTTDIKTGGLDKIIKAYRKITGSCKSLVTVVTNNDGVNTHKLNYNTLRKLFEQLIWLETKTDIWENTDIELNEHMFESMEKFVQGTSSNIDFVQKIQFNSPTAYYTHYLGLSVITSGSLQHVIRQMVFDYIKSINWCLKYYLDACIDYTWTYNYHVAPLIKDICRYYPKTCVFTDNVGFPSHNVLTPKEQLVLVIPPLLWSLVLDKGTIEKVKSNIKINYMFPNAFLIDVNTVQIYWKSIVRIPFVNYELYKTEMEKMFST